MLTCRESAKLMSEALDRKLSLGERAGLRLHLAICAGCRNFRAQMDLLREACRRLARGEAPLDDREP